MAWGSQLGALSAFTALIAPACPERAWRPSACGTVANRTMRTTKFQRPFDVRSRGAAATVEGFIYTVSNSLQVSITPPKVVQVHQGARWARLSTSWSQTAALNSRRNALVLVLVLTLVLLLVLVLQVSPVLLFGTSCW